MERSAAIELALLELTGRADPQRAGWVVGGSAGLMLRGIALAAPPRDLDLYADSGEAAALHEALADLATDRPARSVTPIYESVLSHYAVGGVSVELVGGFVVSSRASRYIVRVRDLLLPCADWRPIGGGLRVPVAPLAHELLFNWLRGREDRVAAIARAMARQPERHEPALRRLMAANALDAADVAQLRERLRLAAEGDGR